MGFYTKKLIRRLKSELGISLPDDVRVYCCRPGWNGLSAGAFSWVFQTPDGHGVSGSGDLGSTSTIKACAQATKLELDRSTRWGDVFIDPTDR